MFVDEERLRAGDNFIERLGEEIESRDGVILLLTPQSTDSYWVQAEAAWAMKCGKRVIPIVQNGVTLARFMLLSHVQQLTLDGEEDEDIEKVARALAEIFGLGSEPRPAVSEAEIGPLSGIVRSLLERNLEAASVLARLQPEFDSDFLGARRIADRFPDKEPAFRSTTMTAEAASAYRYAILASRAGAQEAVEILLEYAAQRFGLQEDPLHLLRGRPLRGGLAAFVKKIRTLGVSGSEMVFSPSGRQLVLPDLDEILIFDLEKGDLSYRRKVCSGWLGRTVERLRKWSMSHAYRTSIHTVHMSPLEDFVLFGRGDGRWGLWSLREDSVRWLGRAGKPVDFLATDGETALCHREDTSFFTAVDLGTRVSFRRFRDKNSREELRRFRATEEFVVAARADQVVVWGSDPESGPMYLWRAPRFSFIDDLDLSANGQVLGVLLEGSFVLWSLPVFRQIAEIQYAGDADRIRLSPDAGIVFLLGDDGVHGIETGTGEEFLHIPSEAREVAVSPIGDVIAVETFEGTELWGFG